MIIERAVTNFEEEELLAPFGFKGGAMNRIWQYSVYLKTREGQEAVGVGCQGVLWSDAKVFADHSPSAGCAMMYLVTEYAAKLLEGRSFETPWEAFDFLLPRAVKYAADITGKKDLRLTFVLNALVGVDQALWQLYFKMDQASSLEQLLPENIKNALGYKTSRIGVIPLVSYGVSMKEVKNLADQGFFFFKIKIGADPDRDGNPEKMLAWDKERIWRIHQTLKDIKTPETESGRILYYLDANGRYDHLERIKELLDYAGEIGMLERIVVLEEPFAEENTCDVRGLPVMVAADESAHSPEDVKKRIALGYRAIALKPIAKTLTVTFRMIEEAMKTHTPCFCADLTVGPYMAEINKAIAARLCPLPGLKIPAMESNGWQNYRNWEEMKTYHSICQGRWSKLCGGYYELNDEFYNRAGGMFEESLHYRQLALKE